LKALKRFVRPLSCPHRGGAKAIAFITFLFGLLALLGWLFLTSADATAVHLLRRSLWYFVVVPLLLSLPLGLIGVIGGHMDLTASALLSLALLVAFEEALKLWASRSETSGIRIFALVSLFGIFELMLVKPLILNIPAGDIERLLYPASAVPAVFLHVLTAAIYAFHWRNSPGVQLIVCAAMHFAFNLVADQPDWVSAPLWLVSILPLAGATWLLIPKAGSERRGSWSLPQQGNSVPA
jgi:hypothetical protein